MGLQCRYTCHVRTCLAACKQNVVCCCPWHTNRHVMLAHTRRCRLDKSNAGTLYRQRYDNHVTVTRWNQWRHGKRGGKGQLPPYIVAWRKIFSLAENFCPKIKNCGGENLGDWNCEKPSFLSKIFSSVSQNSSVGEEFLPPNFLEY